MAAHSLSLSFFSMSTCSSTPHTSSPGKTYLCVTIIAFLSCSDGMHAGGKIVDLFVVVLLLLFSFLKTGLICETVSFSVLVPSVLWVEVIRTVLVSRCPSKTLVYERIYT